MSSPAWSWSVFIRRRGDDLIEWGTAPWHIEVATTPTSLPAGCDVAVIGAGFTGLSAAYHLARAGARVCVLEATRVGAGASGRTGALVLEGTAAGPLPGADDCLAFLERLTNEADIACDLRLPGCLELIHRHEFASGQKLWPDGNTTLYVGGREPGGTVDAGALVSGLARAAIAAGALLHENTRVLCIDTDARPVLHLADRRLEANAVVVAVNAWTPTFLPLPIPVAPALTLALSTGPLDAAAREAIGLAAGLPFYTVDLPYLWGRLLADGRLVLGAGLVFPDSGNVEDLTIGDDAVAAAIARLETRVGLFHPEIAAAGITSRWGGPIAFRRETLRPIVARHPDAPSVVVTGAYAGHGVALAPRVGALVAEALLHERPLPAWGALAADDRPPA